MIRQLAEKSGGQFTATFMSASPDYPKYPAPGARAGGGRGTGTAFPGQVADATADQQAAITALGASLAEVLQAATTARAAFSTAVYDGVFFVSTTGNLPIPDLDAFLKWVADGHGVMGLHGALDTQLPESYIEMFGGGARFAGHPGGGNTARNIVRIDPNHPATKDWGDRMQVVDEFYRFSNFDRAKVHSLLDMEWNENGATSQYPVAWVKTHGEGRVFYTSMGHRDDVMLPDIPSLDYGNGKQNSNEVSEAYRKHVLGGIRWALGLVDADSQPQTTSP